MLVTYAGDRTSNSRCCFSGIVRQQSRAYHAHPQHPPPVLGHPRPRRAVSQVLQHTSAPITHHRFKMLRDRCLKQPPRRVSKGAVRVLSRKLSPSKSTKFQKLDDNIGDKTSRCQTQPYGELKSNTKTRKIEARICRQVMLELRFGEIRITVLSNPTRRAAKSREGDQKLGLWVFCVVILVISVVVLCRRRQRYE